MLNTEYNPCPQESGKYVAFSEKKNHAAEIPPRKISSSAIDATVPLRSAGLAANAEKSLVRWFDAQKTSEIQYC